MHGEKGPEDITRIDAKKDLGIWLSPNLSFSLHLEKSAQKAFAVLRMIRRTFSRITRTDFQILYGAYVRPLLEYANPVVYSGRTKDVILIERVQRAATKMVAGLKSMDYETRLVVLDLFPLEYRRLRGDLILTYALFEQGLANRFFTVDPADTRRGHGESVDVMDKFVYLGTCISSGGLAGDEIISRIEKVRAAFASLRHLWYRRNVSLSVKGRVTLRWCDPYCFMDQRVGPYAQRTYGRCQCLIIGVSAALVSLEQSIKALTSKRQELDKRGAELGCSLYVFHALHFYYIARPDFTVLQSNAKSLSGMIGLASELAMELSGKIRQLDLVKSRVMNCVSKLDHIIKLKQSVSKRYCIVFISHVSILKAAAHVSIYLNTEPSLLQLTSQITSDKAARDSVTTLKRIQEHLVVLTEQRFTQALQKNDAAAVERFCKLFPLLGRREDGLQRFGGYLCTRITKHCEGLFGLSELSDDPKTTGQVKRTMICLDLLTQIVEFIAETVRDNQVYVETYFGPGNLLAIATPIQGVCDEFINRIIRRFRTQYRLTELFQVIQNSSTSTSSGKSQSVASTGSQEGLQFERVLSLEPIISEVVLLNTRTELYMRFMRRHVVADAQSVALSETELQNKFKEITAVFDNCQTVRQMQDLIANYITLEGFYMRETVLKAVTSDEVDDSTKTLRFADDVFFILKQCLSRALSSGSVDGICAMLNHARTILLDHLVSHTLSPRIRAGFPSGWIQDAYSYMQSSVAAVTPVASSSGFVASSTGVGTSSASSASSSGNVARQQFLVTLNTLEACLNNLNTLTGQLERDLNSLFNKPEDPASRKVQACLTELKHSTSEQLQRLLDSGLEQLTTSVIRGHVKSVLQTFTGIHYGISEDDLDMYAANDPWVEACVADLEAFLKPFRNILSGGNTDRVVSVLTTELARRLEFLLQRKSYNRFGAIQLEKEMRCLFAYLTSITYTALRDHFTRLLQICNLLNLDKVDEVTFYWNSPNWRLLPNEVRRILSLRTDFSTDEIRRLKL
ncbi:conserved oligomeric Golgi complex subunit 4 [Clonorchis sinensis]|uniref:Conserved oligomeric Golgi complex subunit 4 n=1 Tax=Clonorchis sinensis TaxID=79923 RepID=H2KS09_CLOSI|nr:conserved oligomeric Golgi complex subunit 4 [Clonorchis sinensis]